MEHPSLQMNKPETGQHLEIYTTIASRFRVFDLSGKLPFHIVFGLIRRSQDDVDPRPLIIQTANSILDVPFALSQGLLQLRERTEEHKEFVQVDVGPLSQQSDNEGEVILPSRIGREVKWKRAIVTYQYHIDPSSDLALLFEPGKTYQILKGPKNEFGGKFTYGTPPESPEEQSGPSTSGEKQKLTANAHGRAEFRTAPSLPWPPKLQTQMKWNKGEGGTGRLEVTVSHMGTEPITVQTSGTQHFCVPNGPLGAEEGHIEQDTRSRIIHANSPSPGSTIRVVDIATGTITRETGRPGFYQNLDRDPRPRLRQLATIKPGEPLVRQVDISLLTSKLPDGTHGLQMEPRGMWWCVGNLEGFGDREDRVPQDVFQSLIPPVVLECEDIVEVQVKDGVVV